LKSRLPANVTELLGDEVFYRETYSEFGNEIFLTLSSLDEAGEDFKKTEFYAELKRIFSENPTYCELFLVWN
jgi:hypothetical protein